MEKYREIENELESLRDQSNEYSKAQTSLMAKYREAGRELNELLSKRPGLVAEVALGERDEADIIQTRARILELEAIIAECSCGNDWLEQRRKELKKELDQRFKEPAIARVMLRDYVQFRDQFSRKYQTAIQDRRAPHGAVMSLFGALRGMAKPVNRQDEAEDILAEYEIPEA